MRRYYMHEIFTYNRVKERFYRQSYSWERVFNVIERVINVSDIMVTYPKNLYQDDLESTNVYLFSKNCIYNICSLTNGKEFEIITIKPDNITNFKLNFIEDNNVMLTLCLGDEEIILSSKEDASEYLSYKYADVLLEIVKIYST